MNNITNFSDDFISLCFYIGYTKCGKECIEVFTFNLCKVYTVFCLC